MPTDASQVVGAWITSKNIKCPACGGTKLDPKPQITISLPVVGGRLVTSTGHRRLGFGGLPGMPVVAATCDDCGYVLQFSAIKVGAMQKAY